MTWNTAVGGIVLNAMKGRLQLLRKSEIAIIRPPHELSPQTKTFISQVFGHPWDKFIFPFYPLSHSSLSGTQVAPLISTSLINGKRVSAATITPMDTSAFYPILPDYLKNVQTFSGLVFMGKSIEQPSHLWPAAFHDWVECVLQEEVFPRADGTLLHSAALLVEHLVAPADYADWLSKIDSQRASSLADAVKTSSQIVAGLEGLSSQHELAPKLISGLKQAYPAAVPSPQVLMRQLEFPIGPLQQVDLHVYPGLNCLKNDLSHCTLTPQGGITISRAEENLFTFSQKSGEPVKWRALSDWTHQQFDQPHLCFSSETAEAAWTEPSLSLSLLWLLHHLSASQAEAPITVLLQGRQPALEILSSGRLQHAQLFYRLGRDAIEYPAIFKFEPGKYFTTNSAPNTSVPLEPEAVSSIVNQLDPNSIFRISGRLSRPQS